MYGRQDNFRIMGLALEALKKGTEVLEQVEQLQAAVSV
jgi:hypothetical protein